MTVAENIWIRREPLNRFGFVDHGEMHRQTAGAVRAPQHRHRPAGRGRRADGRQPADGRDRQGGLLRFRRPDHGRADLGADRARGRAPVPDHPRRCKAQGNGIIYITHKMNELFADRRRGLGVPRRPLRRHARLARTSTRDDDHPHDGRARDHRRCSPRSTVPIGDVVLSVKRPAPEGGLPRRLLRCCARARSSASPASSARAAPTSPRRCSA